MGKIKDLAGQRFGRLTIIKYYGKTKNRKILWLCECDCGNEIIVAGNNLKSGNTQSCGCYHSEQSAKNFLVHGQKHTKLYNVWCGMKSRCNNPHNKSYSNYGGRGIQVCNEWNSFEKFFEWAISNGYQEGLSIDRVDVNGNYCPENCKWATVIEQANNTRANHFVEYNGENLTIAQWEAKTKLPIGERLSYGWSIEEAITTKKNRNYQYFTYKGETKTISDWSKEYNLPYLTLRSRLLRLHWDIEKALLTPIKNKEDGSADLVSERYGSEEEE